MRPARFLIFLSALLLTTSAGCGGTETRWAAHIAADPRVRLRLDERLYDLRARRVTDAAEVYAFAEAWTSQSFFRRDPRGYDEVWLFELLPR